MNIDIILFTLILIIESIECLSLTPNHNVPESCHQSILNEIEKQSYQLTDLLKSYNNNLKGKAKEIVESISYNFGPRPVGSESLNKLVNILLTNLTAVGLDDLRTVESEALKWNSKNEALEMVSPWSKKILMYPLIGSTSINEGSLESEVIVVSSISEIKSIPSTNQKRIIAINCKFTTYTEAKYCRENAALEAFKSGYAFALIRSTTSFSLHTLHTGWIGNHQKLVPTASITTEDMDLLENISKTQTVTLKVTLFTESERVPVKHIVGTFLGSQPSSGTVVLGAHLDSVPLGLGALDDASGIAIAMQTMLVLRNYYVSINKRPVQNIKLILWNGEEVEQALSTELLIQTQIKESLLNQISIVVEADDGNFKPNGLSFKGTPKSSEIVDRILRQIEPIINIGPLKIFTSNLGSTDAARYASHNVPSALISTHDEFIESKYFYYHHSEADVPSVVKSEDLDNNILFLSYFIDSISNLPCQLPKN